MKQERVKVEELKGYFRKKLDVNEKNH